MVNGFEEKVLRYLKNIPKGKVTTYKNVSEKFGINPRYVGMIMKKNDNPYYPCYKVVKSDGSIGGYNRGKERKRELLKREGVMIDSERVDPEKIFN